MSTEQKTIFLVDDNTTNLTAGRNTLAEHYNIFTLNSGERLLKMLEKTIPDLILLDIEMPEMDGYDIIKIIKNKEATWHIPIIFLTAKSDSDSELKGLSMGAVDYITTPFSPPRLLKRIEMHLLVETQKQEILKYNKHLQDMLEDKSISILELQNVILKTMAELVECRDDITGKHTERTQSYFSIMLNFMFEKGIYLEEISSWNVELVLQSTPLHDIGKIAISDSILKKTGKLTEEEINEIKKHPTVGEEVIAKIKMNTKEQEFLEYARLLAATHHEKWDGSGYPKGLKGTQIPLQGRIMAVADVYDALISDRPYKEAFSHNDAVSIILDSKGSHFDPVLTDVFAEVSAEFDKIAKLYAKPVF
jgi:putative two-component system response regulator